MNFTDKAIVVQAIIAKKVIRKDELLELLKGSPVNLDGQNKIIEVLREHLLPYGYEATRLVDQEKEGVEHYAIINKNFDGITSFAVKTPKQHLKFLKCCIDKMFSKTNNRKTFCLTKDTSLKLARDMDIAEEQARSIIDELLCHQWLKSPKPGVLILGDRFLAEYKSFLKLNYAEDTPNFYAVPECSACDQIVIVGSHCSNEECSTALHDSCHQKLNAHGYSCDKCKTPWERKLLIGYLNLE